MMVWTEQEQREHRRDWVKALRSGQYKQGRGYLRSYRDQYCCLGVACDLSGCGKWSYTPDRDLFLYQDHTSAPQDRIPPVEVLEYFGITGDGRLIEGETPYVVFWELNDLANLTFDQIADYIEWTDGGYDD